MTYELGRITFNTFRFPLFGKDLIRHGGKVLFVMDMGYFSVAVRLRG